eukprot:TRINITY_DN2406_c1_g1_i2.p1 TRINITY_DN2406_c1_g1~~TRINITY_DN2406_c1_g1_i2.p1  ORF type:complete len:446 (+),score=92.41 TRINITY_DN2406_c1_g1_i2:203-1540(+)
MIICRTVKFSPKKPKFVVELFKEELWGRSFFFLLKKDFDFIEEHIRKGDIISVNGSPNRTQRGELTIIADNIALLSPCLHELPDWNNLLDQDMRFRQRYLDLIVNRGITDIFKLRSQVIKSLRSYLDDQGFTEVETPILSVSSGGALAKPFVTNSISLSTPLSLRIAPELFLKQLVVGGLDRVYEIGKSFRNEGIDSTHNPEFTMCEFYMAYTDYYQLMDMTEEILRKIVKDATGSYIVEMTPPKEKDKKIVVDFSKPFARISIMEELEKELGESVPPYDAPDAIPKYKELCKKHRITYDDGASVLELFDDLVSHFVEVKCYQPTFLIDHPEFISPLARKHRHKTGVVERFELFICRMEICNSYTELNDPRQQDLNFDIQTKQLQSTNLEKTPGAFEMEKNFVKSLEYGLPPTGGWGMGIDRFIMLITGKTSIREVILYPVVKPK